MSTDTTDLIERLAGSAQPVRRLAPPWRRALWWCALALAFVVLGALIGPAPGVARMMSDGRFLAEQVAAAATAVLAAVAAFSSAVPGASRRWLWLPLFPLAVWIGTIGQGCIADWARLGSDGLRVRADWSCFGPMLAVGIVPTAVLCLMLRRGAAVRPSLSLALGGLAAAAATNVALQMFHVGDVSIMVLVWHVGGALLLTTLAAWLGRWALPFPGQQSGRAL